MPFLCLEGVSVRFGPNNYDTVLKSVSLALPSNQLIAIIGPSGSGKTTLMRAIAGLQNLNEGAISIDKVAVRSGQVSIAFQDPVLLPWLSAIENVRFPTRISRANRNTVNHQDLLLSLGFEKQDLRKRPMQLSRGMQARVELARAIALERRVFLADEPFASLDYRSIRTAHAIIRHTMQVRDSFCLVSMHDLSHVAEIADRVVAIKSRGDEIYECTDFSEAKSNKVSQGELISLLRSQI